MDHGYLSYHLQIMITAAIIKKAIIPRTIRTISRIDNFFDFSISVNNIRIIIMV